MICLISLKIAMIGPYQIKKVFLRRATNALRREDEYNSNLFYIPI
jgi:hypothetical protein